MEEMQNKNDHQLIHCIIQNETDNSRLSGHNAGDRSDDPLSEPEVTVNLNEHSVVVPVHIADEPEEDLFDYEVDNSIQEGNTDSEEQVVPSSQLNSSHKYPDDATISDDEIDEGIFEDDEFFHNESEATEIIDNHRHNSQPP